MKYRDLSIQTQREAPNNARTEGFAFLVRAGYLTRENELTLFGEYTVNHLRELQKSLGVPFFQTIDLPTTGNNEEIFFPIKSGSVEVIDCTSCNYADRVELARFAKSAPPQEEQLPLEKALTPDCNTIESLAHFLGIPKEKTAKALMYTRTADNKLVFAVVRGDMQMSEAKLRKLVGDVHLATEEEISKSGAAPGYASPVGLKDALVVVDDLIPRSHNLVAGANEPGYHLKNTNYGRDYQAEIVADLVQAQEGDSCPNCGKSLSVLSCILLSRTADMPSTPIISKASNTSNTNMATRKEFYFENILLALAENYHDERGLTLPKSAAPFEVYLMNIPGKEMDTCAKAEEIYATLRSAGITVLFDDRDERAGVKFNDADLIGCPVRVTVGEKNLKEGMVELKLRTVSRNHLIPLNKVVDIGKRCYQSLKIKHVLQREVPVTDEIRRLFGRPITP